MRHRAAYGAPRNTIANIYLDVSLTTNMLRVVILSRIVLLADRRHMQILRRPKDCAEQLLSLPILIQRMDFNCRADWLITSRADVHSVFAKFQGDR